MQFRGRNGGVPLHSPPFKIAMSQSNELRVKDVVELHVLDVSQSSWVFAMELRCEFWCRNFRSGLPGIVFTAISFPLDKVLESSLVPNDYRVFPPLLTPLLC